MKLSYKKVEAYCNEMYNILSKMNGIFDDINNTINRLESSNCWEGKGYQYYFEKLKKITNTFEEVNISIHNNIRYLEQTAESYNSLDKKIISTVVNAFEIKGSGK